MLSTRDLVAGYDERTVLDGLDLDLPADAFTVIVGPNACGKSTLLRTMARLLTPRRGTVLLDGTAIRDLPTREVARRLGVLPQSPLVPEGVTVADLVGRGRQPYQRWWRQWSSEDGVAVEQAMTLADVADLADRPVDSLSGGQRQRVWIAMTLAQDTDALLLDEPTTFLDLAHQVEVLDLLHRLRVERGRTVVAVLHDLNQAARYADHLVAMRAGAVVAAGPPREILTADLVHDVFGLACVVVPCPVTGAPLVVPAYTGGHSTGAAASAGGSGAAAASAGASGIPAATAGQGGTDLSDASVPGARPASGDGANPLADSYPSKGL
ncbi:ABC transporter ATP-binding protein [Micromonospora orduensis]|uniref:ABC transporter ATP-binding protein n=1 Tax=Micromonospora orduensis TaxID=1420891 RepID=UPI00142EB276|nr:ABC transporter ATP-binding protein [Micromonospora orduensis]